MSPTPCFSDLYGIFTDLSELPETVTIAQEDLPGLYHQLLAHSNHMTVTLDKHYRQSVEVEVLASRQVESIYSRKILLKLPVSKRVVQFGVVKIKMDELPKAAQFEVLRAKKPLGRVLIEHNVMTQVQPVSFFRLEANANFSDWFSVSLRTELYGRIGLIYTTSHSAIEVLEVLAPAEIAD